MMFKLKRGFYLVLGILTQLFVCYIFKLILFGLINNMNKDTSQLTGIIIGSLLGILSVTIIQLILYLLSHWHRENDSIIFYYFFKSIKKCKVVHHEYLGDFIIQIDNSSYREVTLFKQDWFSFEHLNSFDLQDDPEVLAKNIK